MPGDGLAVENRLLRGIIDVTCGDLDVREVAGRVAALVVDATQSDVCFVHVLDEARNRLVLSGATPPFDLLAGEVELAVGEGIAGWVAAHAEPAVVHDKWGDPRYRYIPALRGEDYSSLVSVPMLVRGRDVVGVLNVHAKQPRSYGDRDLALLTQVAGLMARAVDNARLYQRLAEREETLERFAARTVDAQEQERRRLAGDIHDGICQPLISLWYHLVAIEDGLAAGAPAEPQLRVAKDLAAATLDEARRAIADLRPSVLDDLGLGPSLESLARTTIGPQVELDVSPCRLPAHVEVALYRIAQEALQNVIRHAAASTVTVRLAVDADGVRLEVRDDGRGLPSPAVTAARDVTYGLAGMRERAELINAKLTVVSEPGKGTSIEVVVA